MSNPEFNARVSNITAAISFVGGKTKLAKALNISASYITKWLTDPTCSLSWRRALSIEKLTNGAISARSFYPEAPEDVEPLSKEHVNKAILESFFQAIEDKNAWGNVMTPIFRLEHKGEYVDLPFAEVLAYLKNGSISLKAIDVEISAEPKNIEEEYKKRELNIQAIPATSDTTH